MPPDLPRGLPLQYSNRCRSSSTSWVGVGWLFEAGCLITLLIQINQKRAIGCYFLFFFCDLDDTSEVPHSCESRTFSDGVTWFLIGLVFLLFCIILFLAWSKVKKYVSKRKTPTPPQTAGKGECPKNIFVFQSSLVNSLQILFIIYNLMATSFVVNMFND